MYKIMLEQVRVQSLLDSNIETNFLNRNTYPFSYVKIFFHNNEINSVIIKSLRRLINVGIVLLNNIFLNYEECSKLVFIEYYPKVTL